MSRWDDIGLWWEDEPIVRGKDKVRPIPQIPETGWVPPKDFPNLSSAKIISYDTETYDPNLLTHGPGWSRGDGHIVGVSLSVEDASWYFPVAHEIQSELNMDKDIVMRFLRDVLKDDRPKVGANLLYDKGWLSTEGVDVGGIQYDVQYAEALIDEVALRYDLDRIALKYLGEGKVSESLYKWSATAYGGGVGPKQRGNIYRCPPALVGPYAEGDAEQPLAIFKHQWNKLVELDLLSLFTMECELIPVLFGMQQRGVTVNLDAVGAAHEKLLTLEEEAQAELDDYAGTSVGVYTPEDLQDLCEAKGILYPTTEKGNPSFVQAWLENHPNKAMQLVTQVRQYNKARVTFIENGVLDKHVNGVIHSSYHPLRGERGGAVSGRYSSSNPNMQQIPSRSKIMAPLVRGVYVPELHYTDWCKFDLSQIEYRLFAHDSEDWNLIKAYQDRDADFHKLVGAFLGGKLPRVVTKGFNFGSLYGMGKDKTIATIGNVLTPEEIEHLYLEAQLSGDNQVRALGAHFVAVYAKQFPSAKSTLERFAQIAQDTGEVRTILGRRSTFNRYEPTRYGDYAALPMRQAIDKWGYDIKRAQTHKALNRRLQGGAADLMKKGMLNAYKAGLFAPDKMGFPHVIVHDEWGFSYHPDLRRYFLEFKDIIENAIPLKVPVILDAELGPDWGHVKEVEL